MKSSVHLLASCLGVSFLVAAQEIHCSTCIVYHVVGQNAPEKLQVDKELYLWEDHFLHTKYHKRIGQGFWMFLTMNWI